MLADKLLSAVGLGTMGREMDAFPLKYTNSYGIIQRCSYVTLLYVEVVFFTDLRRRHNQVPMTTATTRASRAMTPITAPITGPSGN